MRTGSSSTPSCRRSSGSSRSVASSCGCSCSSTRTTRSPAPTLPGRGGMRRGSPPTWVRPTSEPAAAAEMAVKACLNGGREREQHFALGQSPLELAPGSGRPERVVDVGAADAFDADQLVPRALAAQDADLRAPDAEAACNQPAQRLVCPPLERGRADARHQHAIAETDDLIAASARL